MVFYKNKWVKNIGRKITLYKNLDSLICMMNHQDAEHKETFKIFFIKISHFHHLVKATYILHYWNNKFYL